MIQEQINYVKRKHNIPEVRWIPIVDKLWEGMTKWAKKVEEIPLKWSKSSDPYEYKPRIK